MLRGRHRDDELDALDGLAGRRVAFDADRDTSYAPSEDELRWLDHEEAREDDERSGLPGPEEREVLDDDGVYGEEPAPDPSERYLPGARKGGSLPKDDDADAAAYSALAGGGAPVPEADREALFDETPVGPGTWHHPDGSVTRYEAGGDAEPVRDVAIDWTEEEALADGGVPIRPMAFDETPTNETEDVSTTPFDAGDDPEAVYDALTLSDWEDAGGAPTRDPMANWSDGEPARVGALGASEPDSDEVGGAPDGDLDDMLTRADARWGDADRRTMEDFGDEYSTGSEVLPMEISPEARALMAGEHAEPDADEMGGPSDGDADNEGAGGLASPWGGPAEERSAEMPASKGAASDERSPTAGADRAATIASLQQMLDGIAQIVGGATGARGVTVGNGASDEVRAAGEAEDAAFARDRAAAREDAAARDAMASRERIAATRATRTPTELELAREERLRRRDERTASLSERSLALREGDSERRAARDERSAGMEDARRDPDSDESDRARQLLETEIATLRPELRAAFESLDLSGLNAEEADAYRHDLPSLLRDRMGRGRSGGGAGGGSETVGTLRAALARYGVELSEEEARALGVRGLRGELDEAIDASESGGDGEADPTEIVRGVHVGVELSPHEREALRHDWRSARRAMDSLGAIEEAVSRADFVERIADPSFLAAINLHLGRMRGLAAAEQGSGIINPGELPVINDMIPDPTTARSMMGGFRASLEEWRRSLLSQLELGLSDYRVAPEELAVAMSSLRGRSRLPTRERRGDGEEAAAEVETVRVRRPDGREGTIPADRLEAALAAGWTEVE